MTGPTVVVVGNAGTRAVAESAPPLAAFKLLGCAAAEEIADSKDGAADCPA